MSLLSDAFTATKKVLLVSEELDRLHADMKALAHEVTDHERRLIRIEALIEFSQRSQSRLPSEAQNAE